MGEKKGDGKKIRIGEGAKGEIRMESLAAAGLQMPEINKNIKKIL